MTKRESFHFASPRIFPKAKRQVFRAIRYSTRRRADSDCHCESTKCISWRKIINKRWRIGAHANAKSIRDLALKMQQPGHNESEILEAPRQIIKKRGGGGRKIARHKIRLDGNIWGLILLPLNCNKSPNKWKILQATNCYVLSQAPHTFTAISGSKTEKPIPMTSLNINTRAVIALGIVIDFLDPANPRALRILDI